MDYLLVFPLSEERFTAESLERVFRSTRGFSDVQHDTVVGNPIEATFTYENEDTTVSLSEDSKAISISFTNAASLQAAWILQREYGVPLRIVDMEYSFDLIMSDYASIEDLEAAMHREHPA